MTATPSAVARYTRDGIVLTKQDTTIRDTQRDAQTTGDTEIESFYNSQADAQVVLNEIWATFSKLSPLHEGIEVSESLGLGTTIPLSPNVPCFTVVDEERGINTLARTRAFSYDTGAESFSVEVLE